MASPAVERVLSKLDGVKVASGGWLAKCPAHDDVHQSLKIDERVDGSVLLHCHAGCAKLAVLHALGLSFADLFAPTPGGAEKKHIVATYDYRTLDGALLYQSVRYQPKDFRQRRPDGAGGWTWNMMPLKGKHVAYRLPDLKGHTQVLVCEGEKDCDTLWKIGIPATCNVGGACKWGLSETKSLIAAGVHKLVIVPDNDVAGKKHAEQVRLIAEQQHLLVDVLELPNLPVHGDVTDWLSNGGSKAALEALLTVDAPPIPDALPFDGLDITQYPCTDLGAAEAFRDRCGHQLRYDHLREKWFVWSGHCWTLDRTKHVDRLAHAHARHLQHEATHVFDLRDRKRYGDFALARERAGPLRAMVEVAKSVEPFAVTGEHWNRDQMVVGCANGVLELGTGTLRDGMPADGIAQQVSVPYDAAATCPRWLSFLDEVFDGDGALINFVHRALGYSLTGDMREQCFFLASGGGANGKSIFLSTLEAVWGTYATRAAMRLFVGEASTFHVADLAGARLVLAAEAKPDTRLNEHIIKSLTGGETQKAERKFGHPFTFQPVCKVWLGVNHVPKVGDDSYGFWRRVRLIPFTRTFTGSADDRTLRDRLVAEAAGILAWVVAGVKAWLTDGLSPPKAVLVATEEYQQAEDPLAEFLAERCRIDAHGVETFAAMHTAYVHWAERNLIPRREQLTRRALLTHLMRVFPLVGPRRFRGVTVLLAEQPPLLE